MFGGQCPVIRKNLTTVHCPLFLPWCLLLSHGRFAWSFSGSSVSAGALTADRQTATMAQTAIAADVHQTLDVHLDTLSEIALYFALGIEDRAYLI